MKVSLPSEVLFMKWFICQNDVECYVLGERPHKQCVQERNLRIRGHVFSIKIHRADNMLDKVVKGISLLQE